MLDAVPVSCCIVAPNVVPVISNTDEALDKFTNVDALMAPDPIRASVPSVITVEPVYVFTPPNINAAVPIFVTDPVPLITPLNVVPTVSLIVRIFPPNNTELRAAPLKSPMVAPIVVPVIFNTVDACDRFTVPVGLSVPEPIRLNVPAVIMVPPV